MLFQAGTERREVLPQEGGVLRGGELGCGEHEAGISAAEGSVRPSTPKHYVSAELRAGGEPGCSEESAVQLCLKLQTLSLPVHLGAVLRKLCLGTGPSVLFSTRVLDQMRGLVLMQESRARWGSITACMLHTAPPLSLGRCFPRELMLS